MASKQTRGRVPAAWKALPPSNPYPTAAAPFRCVGKFVGATVPGRGGGTITACATPTRERPHQGQYWIGLRVSGVGHPMPRRRVSDRLRTARLGGLVAAERGAVAALVEQWERDPDALPAPVGLEFPHRRGASRCDADHALWRGYRDAVTDASERAALETEADPTRFRAAVRTRLADDPRFAAWDAATRDCAKGFRTRERTRAGNAVFSTAREAGRRRAEAGRAGVDFGSSEYLDQLTPRGRAAALRRTGRTREARALERDIRTRRPRARKSA